MSECARAFIYLFFSRKHRYTSNVNSIIARRRDYFDHRQNGFKLHIIFLYIYIFDFVVRSADGLYRPTGVVV